MSEPIKKLALYFQATLNVLAIRVGDTIEYKVRARAAEALLRLLDGEKNKTSAWKIIEAAEKEKDSASIHEIDVNSLDLLLKYLELEKESAEGEIALALKTPPQSEKTSFAQRFEEAPIFAVLNVSALSHNNEMFFTKLQAAIEQFPDLKDVLRFEITESAGVSIDKEQVLLGRLLKLGFHVAVDDCGTGTHATPAKVNLLVEQARAAGHPVALKIDGSLVKKAFAAEPDLKALETVREFIDLVPEEESSIVFEQVDEGHIQRIALFMLQEYPAYTYSLQGWAINETPEDIKKETRKEYNFALNPEMVAILVKTMRDKGADVNTISAAWALLLSEKSAGNR